MARDYDERWGNSRHKLHRQKSTTAEMLDLGANLPIKPYVGIPPRNMNHGESKLTPEERNQLHIDAKTMADFLATKQARSMKAPEWCNAYRVLILMALKSITPIEADERLVQYLAETKAALDIKKE